MADRIGSGAGLARQAIESALKRQAEASRRMAEMAQSQSQAADQKANPQAVGADFASELTKGVAEVSKAAQGLETLPEAIVRGDVSDFHEVTAQLKQSELSFKFALEVRNKFVDAYREVMRMSV